MEHLLNSESRYLRKYDSLFVDCNLSEYLVDYYLNAKEVGLAVDAGHDEQLKQLIACLALHLTVRPPDETVAWTVHMQGAVPYSLFVTGSVRGRFIVGRILYENISHTDVNVFHSQVNRTKGATSRSAVRCETSVVTEMVEAYYDQSEQLAIKVRLIENSDTAVALVAMPGFDEEWFETAKPEEVYASIEEYNYKRITKVGFRFACNCSTEKLLPLFQSVKRSELLELYGEDDSLVIHCPRCGKKFEIARSILL